VTIVNVCCVRGQASNVCALSLFLIPILIRDVRYAAPPVRIG